MKRILVPALLALAALSPPGAGANGSPYSPGLLQGGEGVRSRDGLRFVTTFAGGEASLVAAVRGYRVVRVRMLRGLFAVPLVAYDGTAGGLSGDGRRLVLASYGPPPGQRGSTRFVVLDARTLVARSRIELRGSWSYDASSPDGKRLFLVEHLRGGASPRYRVRVFDLARGLRPGAVVDRLEGEAVMGGEPVTRATSPGGRWAYTLYARAGKGPFVHALDTARTEAFCIDLPLELSRDEQWSLRLALFEGSLAVRKGDGGTTVAVVDTRSFEARTAR
ncbi:MAG TPA: hypothetical protein VNJ53_02640 [Gaiellaceae bacterium]|nr:hypothetical protein [Gaiellaceae bacterium]